MDHRNLYGPLDWQNANFANVDSLDETLDFDLNSRITGKLAKGSADSAVYSYESGTYKLEKVTGDLWKDSDRDATKSGNFLLDLRG